MCLMNKSHVLRSATKYPPTPAKSPLVVTSAKAALSFEIILATPITCILLEWYSRPDEKRERWRYRRDATTSPNRSDTLHLERARS